VLKFPKLLKLVEPYLCAGTLRMANLYIREAHPVDGWEIKANASGAVATAAFGVQEKISVIQTRTLEDRLAVANRFQAAISSNGLCEVPMFVDDPATNALDVAYEAVPERLVLLDARGNVLFCTGQGPYQYSLIRLRDFLTTTMGAKL
jgi:hypothetical protein